MKNYKLTPTPVAEIRPGDTVEYKGELRTVCAKDIIRGGFMGTTVFGDSFRSGTQMVQRATFHLQV